jgi:hypothetical protein
MNTMHLIGADDVARGGHNMQQAAGTISSAASTIDEAGRRMAGQLETHGYQMEALATAMASLPTLRDYFAMHAPPPPASWHGGDRDPKDLIEWSWGYADRMMKAREA